MPPAKKTNTNAAKKTEALRSVDDLTQDDIKETVSDLDNKTKVNTFEFKGVTFEVPSDPLDLPVEVLEAEDEVEVIQAIVGPDQWAAFKATRARIRDFRDFADLVTKAAGYGDMGN